MVIFPSQARKVFAESHICSDSHEPLITTNIAISLELLRISAEYCAQAAETRENNFKQLLVRR